MMTMKPGSVLQKMLSLAALSAALAACGGGDDSPYKPTTDPQPPVSPAPPPPPPTGPVTPPPPVDPAPPTDPAPELHLAAGYTNIDAAEALSTPRWADWNYTGTNPIDGVACASSEAYHIHAMVSFYLNGKRLALPKNIGRSACNYDMHTHDGSGIVHVETGAPKAFTLGQFFSLWGQTLNPNEVAGLAGTPTFYVVQNEQITKVTGNPDDILLEAHKEIVIVNGTPPTEIPRFNWGVSGL